MENAIVASAEMVARPGAGTIAGIIGPEGAGKTSLLTGFASCLWEAGWDVYAFPGYNLLNPIRNSKDPDKQFKVLSKTIMPEDWVSLPMDLHDIVICISEADSHFNSLETQFDIAKEFNNMLKQRRKRSLTVLYDVQNWSWFNNRARWSTHLIFNCWDMYWSTRNSEIPVQRGQKILVTPYDCKGFYTGRPWTQGKPFYFNSTKIHENFNTNEITNYEQSAASYKVKRYRNELGIAGGKVIVPGADSAQPINMKAIEKIADQYAYNFEDKKERVKAIVGTFLKKGNSIPAKILRSAVEAVGIKLGDRKFGEIMTELGGKYIYGREGSSTYVFGER